MTRVPRRGREWQEAAGEPAVVGVEDPEDVDVGEAEADLVVVPGAKISHFGSFYCKSGTCCGAIKMQPY